jgi:hypothetical protein
VVGIQVETSDFSLLQRVLMDSDTHPSSLSLDTGVLSREYSDHLVSRLRMSGTILVLPLYAFTTWTRYLQPVHMRPLLDAQRTNCVTYSLEQHQQRSREESQ